MRSVSRAWAFETGLAAGVELGSSGIFLASCQFEKLIHLSEIPVNEYYEYFGPDYQLDVKASNVDDINTRAYMERVKSIVMENLKSIQGPPSVQMTGAFGHPVYC